MIGTLVRLLLILGAVSLSLAVGSFVYRQLGQSGSLAVKVPTGLEGPVSDDPRREGFSIKPGQSASEIGDELQRRGLIRSALAFRWEVESRGLGTRLAAGEYSLSPSMSTAEVVSTLVQGASSSGTGLTVVEGWRADQIARRAEQVGLGKGDEILRLVLRPREQGLTPPDPAADSLEGYLFPDTYQFDPKANPREIVETMVRQFSRRVDDQLRTQAASRGLTLGQLVALASIVEREAASPNERSLVASVYANRLATGMRLQSDPTVQYAVANRDLAVAENYDFWKHDLTQQDLKLDSPYNTYQVPGLPPGPICNPGLDALRAAAAPALSSYLYFVARGDGSHAFAETLEQHLANVQKYR